MENSQREAQRVRKERGKFEAEASAALQDAREALARESEIQEQLQKADQVPCLFFPLKCVDPMQDPLLPLMHMDGSVHCNIPENLFRHLSSGLLSPACCEPHGTLIGRL